MLSERSIDVRFDAFMADELRAVERIYDVATRTIYPAVSAAIAHGFRSDGTR